MSDLIVDDTKQKRIFMETEAKHTCINHHIMRKHRLGFSLIFFPYFYLISFYLILFIFYLFFFSHDIINKTMMYLLCWNSKELVRMNTIHARSYCSLCLWFFRFITHLKMVWNLFAFTFSQLRVLNIQYSVFELA